jgi:hypothetical protein
VKAGGDNNESIWYLLKIVLLAVNARAFLWVDPNMKLLLSPWGVYFEVRNEDVFS